MTAGIHGPRRETAQRAVPRAKHGSGAAPGEPGRAGARTHRTQELARGMGTPVVIVCTDRARGAEADELARRLGLPRLSALPAESGILALVLDRERTVLRACGPDAPGPVAAEFGQGPQAGRRRRAGIRHEALARAAGLGRGHRPEVVDATAGLGRDSFLLASLGCRVVSCERNPVVAALLADGLERATRLSTTREAAARVELAVGDARPLLAARTADVVLVDPMHPPRRKSAAVRKEMQLLQQLVGPDDDGAELLAAALAAARERVVVKRPRHGAPLPGPPPLNRVTGRSTRFDVYRGQATPPE